MKIWRGAHSIARSCSTTAAHWRPRIWKLHRMPRAKPELTWPPPKSISAFWAEIPRAPAASFRLRAPVSGTIVEQNVAGFESVKSLDNTPNLFTIADLSQVWVVCDVFENDLGQVHIGDPAEVRLNAFSDRVFQGKVADISRVLDPSTRSAKVRIVLPNGDGALRPGMFAVATFRSRKTQPRVVVPTTAVMRLHDKDWIFEKDGSNRFRRMEVHAMGTAAEGFTQLQDGVQPGQEIVAHALEFSTAVAEQGK